MQNTKFALNVLTTVTALALAACGGGGGDDATSPTPAPAPTPAITAQGSAPAVSGDPLAVVFVPQTETSTRAVLQSIAHNAFPAQFQKATEGGAYTQLGIDANSLITLNAGKVVDIAGTGEFAIGRWTDGSSSIGSLNINQGAHYAVGKPLKLLQDTTLQPDLSIGPKLSCNAIASTAPTAITGNFAPGKLNAATATLALAGPTLQTVSLDVSIGTDSHVMANISGTILNGVFQSNGVLHHVQVVGSSQSSPYLLVGYAMPTPSSGDVTGIVVLKCQ
ncbi:hypothetical protein [Cupriavidus necator]